MDATLEKNKRVTAVSELFTTTRQHTEEICAPLKTEDFVPQPIGDVSPPKWHLAHTTWFFEAFILNGFLADYKEYHADFSYVFNSYYRAAGERVEKTKRGNLSRPSVEDIFDFRRHVNEGMDRLLEGIDQHPKRDEIIDLLELGINHEQQHQELLITDIKFILGDNPLKLTYKSDSIDDTFRFSNRNLETHHSEGGVVEIGFEGSGFSYDNEHGRHRVFLEPFEIAKDLVTNGEFMEFMKAGGYKDFRLWLDEGWEFVKNKSLSAPLYWFEENGEWFHYTLSGVKKVDPNEPVKHISFFEADAFARWKGWRLPTEFEWESVHNHLNYGQLWEWTGSAYLPYPRYEIPEGATGEYNGKFMVNQKVLRGGSVATAKGHARPTYRNFWHTDKRWQYTGIRLARTL
ncbi:ergothioneine biosynthesis protein EgtB [Halocola ammonii]